MSSEIAVADDPGRARYVITVDGSRAGFLTYRLGSDRLRSGQISLLHAEIDPALEGRGLGGQLTAFALDEARARDLSVLPFCPFVRTYIERHPNYLELVPPGQRQRFGL